jgi:hypothetical protein
LRSAIAYIIICNAIVLKKNILKIVAQKFVGTQKRTLFLQRKQNYKTVCKGLT